jgi:hypothetical protein
LGYRRPGRLRPSPPALLPRLPRYPDLLCRRLARLARQRTGEGTLTWPRLHGQLLTTLQWISEVLHFCQGLPIILVGCKKDLRFDQKTIEELHKTSQKPVTPEQVSHAPQHVCHCTNDFRPRMSARRLVPRSTSSARRRPTRVSGRYSSTPHELPCSPGKRRRSPSAQSCRWVRRVNGSAATAARC